MHNVEVPDRVWKLYQALQAVTGMDEETILHQAALALGWCLTEHKNGHVVCAYKEETNSIRQFMIDAMHAITQKHKEIAKGLQ